MFVTEANQQNIPNSARISRKLIARILKEIERHVYVEGILSLAFISEKKIQELNKIYRGKDKVTDVLAFPLNDTDEEGHQLLGEVLICYPQAKRQSKEREHTAKQEVVDLFIHGMLHVLGFDHETNEEADVMLPLQDKIYGKIKKFIV